MAKRGFGRQGFVVVGGLLFAFAAHAGTFQMTPAVQASIDKQKTSIEQWAADPTIVAAVVAQNKKGPLADMDNAKWKGLRRSDPVVKEFQDNAAGKFLGAKIADSKGQLSEAFLSGAQGEKVAFVEKTTSYIHKGQPKFDVPFGGAPLWQGEPSFDESTQGYEVQLAVPVKDGGKPVGVLVVGVNVGSQQ